MHECMLCEKDMKKSTKQFGSGCINNTFKFLDITEKVKNKEKEQYLYENIAKRLNVSGINKEQKVWLTNRYLTYMYLDKLNYGNFEELKEQINNDIKNISDIKKFKDMVTAREIRLKEAYSLYKKEKRFAEDIIELKNVKEDKKIKLLIASFSYIFNMYKNKSQYEKDAFKAMQYAFWQTVIEVGGRYANFDIAAYFLQHSLKENADNLFITDGNIVEEIKKDKQFQKNINNIVKKYGSNNNEFVFDSNINDDYPMNFNNSDLYFAIHSAALRVIGKKQNDKWNLNILLHDKYDYSEPKKIREYFNDTNSISKSIFSSTLYNLAYCSIKLEVMKEYEIDIQITLNNYEVK